MAGSDEQHSSDSASSADAPGPLSRLLEELARAPAGDNLLAAWRDELRPGDRLDRFEILREIGRGGFGAVYEASDSELGRVVAVKTLRPGRSRRELSAGWVKKEAEAVARLDHPCIVTLFDVGTCPSGPYLVMELLRGETFSQRLEKGPLPMDEALRIAEEMAKGLAHAHQRGVLHRDLKPANVFLCEDGRVKLLDFGLAHLLGHPRDRGAGTPAYMAPEQARGDEVDERADVYAAGKVLEEMLGERRPRRLDQAVASATFVTPAARPRDGAAWLDLLQAARRVAERPSRIRRLALIAGAGIVLGAAVAGLVARRTSRPPAATQTAPLPSIAVLPFADMSLGHDQEYFADGVAEEILNSLSRVEGLHVAGRTSAFSFKGKRVTIQEMGRQLNVRTVLEGSVRREGNRVRITAQVVDVANGYQLWSETYSRELTGIFAVQDDIARAVVEALKVKLLPGKGPGSGEGRTADPDSYRYYLIGLHHAGRGTPEGAQLSRVALEKALELDPGNAPAQAALAIAIFNVWASGGTSTAAEVEDVRRESLAAAEKAVALAPSLADGYAARGWLRGAYFHWAGSRADLDRALALRPNDSRALEYLGEWLAVFGKVTEAIALSRRALELDPLWERPLSHLCFLYMASGELPLARSTIDRWLEITPDSPAARHGQVQLHLLEGHPEAALSVAQRIAIPRLRLLGIALAENDLGHAVESNRALEELTSKFAPAFPYPIARAYAWRGDADRTFEWLERALRARDPNVARVKFDPLLRKIRGDPRYKALLKKMNLPVD